MPARRRHAAPKAVAPKSAPQVTPGKAVMKQPSMSTTARHCAVAETLIRSVLTRLTPRLEPLIQRKDTGESEITNPANDAFRDAVKAQAEGCPRLWSAGDDSISNTGSPADAQRIAFQRRSALDELIPASLLGLAQVASEGFRTESHRVR